MLVVKQRMNETHMDSTLLEPQVLFKLHTFLILPSLTLKYLLSLYLISDQGFMFITTPTAVSSFYSHPSSFCDTTGAQHH